MKIYVKLFFWVLLAVSVISCGNEQEDKQPIQTEYATGNPAIDGLSAKIQESPEDPELYFERGNLFYQNEAYDQAIQDLTAAMSLDSSKWEYYHLLADAYLDYFRSRQALVLMEQAAERFPENIPTLLKLSEFQLILKRNDEALRTLEQIRAIDPQNAEMFYMAGLIMQEMGKTEQAINNFQEAVEIDPDLIEAWVNLGKLWSKKGQDVAIHFYDNALRIDSTNAYALHEKAMYQSNQINDLEGALETYRKLASFHPQYTDAYFNSGLVYLDMDSVQRAKKQFSLAIQVDPTFVSAYYYRGLTNEFLGELNAARNDYEQALRMNSTFEEAEQALERVNTELMN